MISKFKPFLGPAQYVFRDPDTGLEYKENSKKTLIDRIRSYRLQNELPEIEEIDQVLESYWCGLGENVGKCVPVILPRGLLGYFKGGVALIKNLAYNTFVTQEEANRRAKICVECPHNVKPEDTGLAAWADMVAYHATKGHTTEHDSKLFTCSICSCPLKAKCHLGGDLGVSAELKKKLPEYCWQK